MGDELNTAVSAIISALDCPPLRAVTAVSGEKFSPASLFASSNIFSTIDSIFSTILLSACMVINSRAVRSITKFIFCESCATNLLFVEYRHFGSGFLPLIYMVRPVGVSFCAAHSISANNLLFPDPVGPTIDTICEENMSNLSNFSFSPLLLCPGKIVKLSIFSLLSPRNCSICLMNVSSWILISSLSIAFSSNSSSEKPSKISTNVESKFSLISKPVLSKKSTTKGYFSSSSFNFISLICLPPIASSLYFQVDNPHLFWSLPDNRST